MSRPVGARHPTGDGEVLLRLNNDKDAFQPLVPRDTNGNLQKVT